MMLNFWPKWDDIFLFFILINFFYLNKIRLN